MLRVSIYKIPIYMFTTLSLLSIPPIANAAQQSGKVMSGDTPIVSSTVTLFSTGRHHGHFVEVLGKAQTDDDGSFTISFNPPRHRKAILYLIAEGGSVSGADENEEWSGQSYGWRGKHGKWYRRFHRWFGGHRRRNSSPIRLATVLGIDPDLNEVVINERTTVATAYTMAQFIHGTEIQGRGPGPRNASAIIRNVVDVYTGDVSMFLTDSSPTNPNIGTSTQPTLNSLANLLAVCVNDESECSNLFDLTTTPRGRAPRNTLQAAVNIVQFPSVNAGDLFDLSNMQDIYQPALNPQGPAPEASTLVLLYNENGMELDGPGNIAFDKKGNAWVNNNYVFDSDTTAPVCGSTTFFKMTPTGDTTAFGGTDGSGVGAGGLYGAGFGISLDDKFKVWITNFGFQGTGCTNPDSNAIDPTQLYISVSKFKPDGTALSPDGNPQNEVPGGFQGTGNMQAPQGIASDRRGNIWIANCANQSVTRFRRGNPNNSMNFVPTDPDTNENLLDHPFDIAIDRRRHAWVTSNINSRVVELGRDGMPIGDPITEAMGIDKPMGIASDSVGNLWVSNAGVMNPPCPAAPSEEKEIGDDGSNNFNAAVTLIRHRGTRRRVTTFGKQIGTDTRDGLRWPWGIAVDGNDNVWVANFAGQRVMQLCGVREAHCPPGVSTGDAIFNSGYSFDGLTRNTGVQIDPSGNVWLTNNWIIDAFTQANQNNPGGHELAVFLGLAKPVKTPLLGTPRTP